MKKLLTATAILFAAGGTAMAQADTKQNKQSDARETSSQASKGTDSQAREGAERLRDANRQTAESASTEREAPPIVLLRDWNYDRIYGEGWSAKNLMDQATVYGPAGNDMGTIENLVVGRDGKLLGIEAEIGGFLDIGDTHVFVPWDKVRVSDGMKRVTIPVTEENVENYSTSPDGFIQRADTGSTRVIQDDASTGPKIWKSNEIIGDTAVLNGRVPYGTVDDLIFSSDGRIHAIVVGAYARYRGGYRAYPFYGYPYGWAPAYPVYNLGYDPDDVLNLQVMDYRKVKNAPASGTGEATKKGDTTTGSGSAARQKNPDRSNR